MIEKTDGLAMSGRCELAACGREFTRPGIIVEQYGKRFCSFECLDESKAAAK